MPQTLDPASQLEPVISDSLTTNPGSESQGDRYIINGIGGAWSSFNVGDVVTVVDASPVVWENLSPEEGDEVYIKSLKKNKAWDGVVWRLDSIEKLEDLADILSASPTKGGIFAANGTNFAPIGIGTDTAVLTADSTEPRGVKWVVGGASGITETQHKTLDYLGHKIVETAFEEPVYSGNKVTSNVYWQTISKLKKIRECLYTYTGNKVATEIIKQYDNAGILLATLTGSYTYTGNKIQNTTWVLT